MGTHATTRRWPVSPVSGRSPTTPGSSGSRPHPPDGPPFTAEVRVFETTDETYERGYHVPENDMLVTLRFGSVELDHLVGPDEHDVLFAPEMI